MKKLSSIVLLATLTCGALNAVYANSALSLAGYFGSINNNTNDVLECSQVIGGYCANNPMPANGYIQMLPDPGSKMIRGHLMVFEKNVPGTYLDNILFTYAEQNDGSWKFSINHSYNKVQISTILPDTLLISNNKIQTSVMEKTNETK